MKVRVENNPKNSSMEVGTLPLCCSISASKILPKLCYVHRMVSEENKLVPKTSNQRALFILPNCLQFAMLLLPTLFVKDKKSFFFLKASPCCMSCTPIYSIWNPFVLCCYRLCYFLSNSFHV
jgi:hypothetical protein